MGVHLLHPVRLHWRLLLPVGLLPALIALDANAQSVATQRWATPPGQRSESKPSAPAAPSAAYRHDGGYFDVSYAAGGFVSWSGTQQTRRLQGFVPTDVWFGGGGTVGTTVLGASLQYQSILGLSSSDPADPATPLADPSGVSLSLLGLGFFLRHYFDASGGWHLGAGVGLSSMSTSRDDEAPSGAALWADFGHDFWVHPQFCGGPFIRFTTHFMSVEETPSVGEVDLNTVMPVVGIALRNH